MIERLRQRLLNLVARAVVSLVNDAGKVQLLQLAILAGETRDGVQRVQEYGFSSVPAAGAYPVVLLCPGGDRGQAIAIAADDVRYRPVGGQPGDVFVYDLRGNAVRLRSGTLEIVAAAALSITAAAGATVTVTGNATVNATGSITLAPTGALNLGGAGGAAVARVGDSVVGGIITTGSAKVKAV